VKSIGEKLSRADRRFVDRYLTDHDFRGYDRLVELLQGRGLNVSKSALQRYGRRLRAKQESDQLVASVAALLRRKGIASS
jgi:Bacteriophage Mu, Gp27